VKGWDWGLMDAGETGRRGRDAGTVGRVVADRHPSGFRGSEERASLRTL